LENEANKAVTFRQEIELLANYVEQMNQMCDKLDKRLGRRKVAGE
jgi:hypothetical protein